MTQMTIRPEIALREARIMNKVLENRVLVLSQDLVDVTNERDQALSDRDAIRAELEKLRNEIGIQGARDADPQ